MSVRTRLVLTLVGIALLLILPALYAIANLRQVRGTVVELRGRHAVARVALGRLETRLAELDRLSRSYVITADPDYRADIRDRIVWSRAQLDRIRSSGYARVTADVVAAIDTLAAGLGRIEALIAAGDVTAAADGFGMVEARLDSVRQSLDPVARAIDRRSGEEVADAQKATSNAALGAFVALLIAIAIAAAIGAWSTAALTSPLRRLRRATATVAEGDLSAPRMLPYRRMDEIGDLSRSFRSMTVRLAELERLRAEFLSMASHELKTPISVIHSYAEVLAHGTLGEVTEKQAEVLKTIQDQTQLLTHAVNELVQAGRVEAGGFRIEVGIVATGEFFDAVRRAFGALARQQGIDFVVDVGADVPETLDLDSVRMRNDVLGNLVSNAFKFTTRGGRIEIRATQPGDDLIIEVSDTGSGISPERLPHIFDVYYQASSGMRDHGSGLGLAIARRIVEAHGGTLTASSEPDCGTTFRIRLPRRTGRDAGQVRLPAAMTMTDRIEA